MASTRREEFELWQKRKPDFNIIRLPSLNGDYYDPPTQREWVVWQAAWQAKACWLIDTSEIALMRDATGRAQERADLLQARNAHLLARTTWLECKLHDVAAMATKAVEEG